MFHQNWSDFEKAQSSTFRELLAVSLSMKAFAECLKAQTVTWLSGSLIPDSIITGALNRYPSKMST